MSFLTAQFGSSPLLDNLAAIQRNLQSITSALSRETENVLYKKAKLGDLRDHLEICGKSKNGASTILQLNIGGNNIDIKRQTVKIRANDGLLFALLSGRYDHLLPKDKTGRIFLDLDIKWIDPILRHIRELATWDGNVNKQPMPPNVPPSAFNGYETVIKHFQVFPRQLNTIIAEQTESARQRCISLQQTEGFLVSDDQSAFSGTPGGSVISADATIDNSKNTVQMGSVLEENGKISSSTVEPILTPAAPVVISMLSVSSILSQIVQNLDPLILSLLVEDQPSAVYSKASLLYRGSVDGFTSDAFHRKCDGHKSTLSIIRDTENNIFGAYTDSFWDNFSGYKASPKAFLFSLMRNNEIKVEKFSKIDGEQDILCAADKLCTFGQGEDLYVASDCNANALSHSKLGVSFGAAGAGGSLSNVTNFTVLEIEVFEVEWTVPPPLSTPVNPASATSEPTSITTSETATATESSAAVEPASGISITTALAPVDASQQHTPVVVVADEPSPKATTAELVSTTSTVAPVLAASFASSGSLEKICVATPIINSPKPGLSSLTNFVDMHSIAVNTACSVNEKYSAANTSSNTTSNSAHTTSKMSGMGTPRLMPSQQRLKQLSVDTENYSIELRVESDAIEASVLAFRDELKFVAGFIGLPLPVFEPIDDVFGYGHALNETEAILNIMTNDVISVDGSSILTINAGGVVQTVSKMTLLQTPPGSVLAELANEKSVTDKDQNGYFFQDVDAKLFTLIISHLRLKALLCGGDRGGSRGEVRLPPIVVPADDRTSLENLLTFYMINDVEIRSE